VYHNIGLAATHFIRSLGVPCSQYIDDRHVGQLRLPYGFFNTSFSSRQLAEIAAFIACSTLISLGYFIGLKKSSLEATTAVRFLGYICDSERQAFILPQDKRVKFATLRESILKHKSVSLKNLQKFAGKTTSFSLLVPAAKLFTNAVYKAISSASRSSSSKISLSLPLRREILHWRFLDTWEQFLPWRSEYHYQVQLFSDASNYGWGGCLFQRGQPTLQTRGYWDANERKFPIATKETLALVRTLENLVNNCRDTRVDVQVDNRVLVSSWDKQVSKCPAISDAMKSLFQFCASRNLGLSLSYVPSRNNPADSPSRVLSDLDAKLSDPSWKLIDQTFGPHTIDLMALPSNVRHDPSGRPLRFFSPFPCRQSSGTNVFSQFLAPYENAFVFPPFVLVGPLLRFLLPQDCSFSIVVPELCPRKYWWPVLQRRAVASFKLGSKGDKSVILFPSKSGPDPWEPRPLQWDLWLFRIIPSK